jgi:hypothetical protein
MNTEVIIAIIVAIIGSNALWGFVQFLVTRKDEGNGKINDIVKTSKERYNELIELLGVLKENIEKIESKSEERDGVTARVRILRFMDELLDGKKHSKDSFDQALTDITDYENYCNTHPNFKNNQTEATIDYINKVYRERLEKKDFL